MKLFVGCVVSAGLLATATVANAQALQPYRLGASPYVAASDVGRPYASGPYAAIPRYAPPPYEAPALLPSQQVYAILRDNGFSPLGAPQQRGLVYTISVIDPNGDDGRLVIAARSGRIMRFMPAYRIGDRMGEAISTSYGSPGPLPAPEIRAAPRLPLTVPPRLASRTPTMPLPKVPLPKVPQPKVPQPLAAKPVQQSAVVQPKAVDAPVAVPAAAPTVPAAPVETTPVQPTQTMPPAQGLE